MKSWATGKQEILREVEKVYDLIGRELAAELDEKNTVRVNTTQLRALEEHSSKYQDLIERNPCLEDDLRRYKSVCSRLDELADSNKRLTKELDEALRKETPISSSPVKPDHILSDSIIPLASSSTAPTFLHPIEPIQESASTDDAYGALVDKYNIVYEQWKIQNEGRILYQEKWKREREKAKDWLKYCERQDKNIANKKERIKKLREEVRHLRSLPENSRAVSDETLPDGRSKSSAEVSTRMFPDGSPSSALVNANIHIPDALITPRRPEQDMAEISLIPDQGPQNYVAACSVLPAQLSHEETDDLLLPTLPHTTKTIILDSQADSDTESPIYHENSTICEGLILKQDGQSVRRINAVKDEPATDDQESPVVVSARRVKKRKHRSEPEQPKFVPNVKQEILSSSPIGLARFDNLGSNESVDLDEIGQKVDTPRKHRRRLFELSQEQSSSSIRTTFDPQGVIGLGTPTKVNSNAKQVYRTTQAREATASRTGSALQPRSANEQIVPRSGNQTSKRRRVTLDTVIETLAEDEKIPTPVSSRRNGAGGDKLENLLGNPPSLTKSVISPRRLDETWKRAAETATHNTGRADDAQSKYHGLDFLPNSYSASSGSKNHYPKSANNFRPQGEQAPDNVSGASLLLFRQNPGESGSSGSDIRPSGTHNPNSSRISARNAELSRRSSASGTPRRSTDILTPGGMQSRGKSMRVIPSGAETEMDQAGEPIRSRSVESLRLEDFKVNPNYNQGYEYAYSDVVRNKDDRRCLQGCTKPGCCGARFRALALATRPAGEMTLSQEEADNELLQEFLGDNAYKLRNMNKQDRDSLLLQARTRDLANKHGRHRHMYEKPSSPPGFWRADFPTTQEDLLDRERAKQVERDQILQRYEEAMRPGGAFIFRDE